MADPTDLKDAATKSYVDTKNSQQDIAINSKAEKNDVILRDGTQNMTANLNLNTKKITNLANPTDGNDSANKHYVDDQIHRQTNKLFDKRSDSHDLHPNFNFAPNRDFGSFSYSTLIIPDSQVDSFMKNHQHGLLYSSIFHSYYRNNYRKRLRMSHNDLKPGNYTAIFELFGTYDGLFVNNNSNLYIYNQSNYNYVNKKLDFLRIDNHYTKIILQFEVNRNPGFFMGK